MAGAHVDVDCPRARAYLERFTRTVLGSAASAAGGVPPMPAELARLLLRAEEHESAHRDQWGCWEFGESDNFRRGSLWIPEVDVWLDEAAAALPDGREPLWPEGKRFAVSPTHDVDMVTRTWTPAQLSRSLKLAAAGGRQAGPAERVLALAHAGGRAARYGARLAPSAGATLERCVEIERSRGVGASYFFTVFPPGRSSRYDCVYTPADRCEFRGRRWRIRDIMRLLADEGFDVGLHGSYFSATDEGLLGRQKEVLEQAVGRPVLTTRQHWLHWRVGRTPRLQARAGFAADATLGFNRNVGFRAGTSFPFFDFDLEAGEELDLLEIPLVVQEAALFAPNALELGEESAKDVVRRLVDRVARVGGVFSFLVHPHSLLDARVASLYEWLVDHVVDEGAWVASVADIDRWWRARAARLGAHEG